MYYLCLSESFADGTEERLYRTLLSEERYEKDVRPTAHHSQAYKCYFWLSSQSNCGNDDCLKHGRVTLFPEAGVAENDERNQVLTTRSWLNINWMDKRLVWNYTEWGGIKTIYIPHKRLWKPDIILVNK
ncbi:hypothetical protein OSTOST_16687 [Ostertagia ostertagi]